MERVDDRHPTIEALLGDHDPHACRNAQQRNHNERIPHKSDRLSLHRLLVNCFQIRFSQVGRSFFDRTDPDCFAHFVSVATGLEHVVPFVSEEHADDEGEELHQQQRRLEAHERDESILLRRDNSIENGI